jgi:class 3 adenylate cyclase
MESTTQRPSGTVTFLFTDVESSTRKWEEHQAAMRDAMATHDALVRTAIESLGGAVFTTAGDSFCAAFASPRSALEAAIRAQISLGSEPWGKVSPFRVRMALHSGNADERDGDYFGPPLNRCARLLSIGHGGQILLSLATVELLSESLPDDVALVDLGAHRLKDLDRDEEVFQVSHPDLDSDFPALRSAGPVRDAASDVAAARQAHAGHEWNPAYEAYQRADAGLDLDAEDIQRFGESAWWIGRNDEGVALRERAYASFLREGKEAAAGGQAVGLAEMFSHRLAPAVAKGWLARSERLLENHQDSAEYGYLLRLKSVWAFDRDGDTDQGLALTQQVLEIGTRLGDPNWQALAIQDRGRFLVSM